LASVVHNTRLFHELEKILRAFQAAGIMAVPLKGAWLVEAAYRNIAVNNQRSTPGLRTLLDLDCARQRLNVDWGTVAERARAWRVSTATWLVLRMLAELFGDPYETGLTPLIPGLTTVPVDALDKRGY